MYKLISSFYGQLSSANTLELAIEKAKNMRKSSGEIICVYCNNVKLYEAR